MGYKHKPFNVLFFKHFETDRKCTKTHTLRQYATNQPSDQLTTKQSGMHKILWPTHLLVRCSACEGTDWESTDLLVLPTQAKQSRPDSIVNRTHIALQWYDASYAWWNDAFLMKHWICRMDLTHWARQFARNAIRFIPRSLRRRLWSKQKYIPILGQGRRSELVSILKSRLECWWGEFPFSVGLGLQHTLANERRTQFCHYGEDDSKTYLFLEPNNKSR